MPKKKRKASKDKTTDEKLGELMLSSLQPVLENNKDADGEDTLFGTALGPAVPGEQ